MTYELWILSCVMVHVYNPRTQEAEAELLQVQGSTICPRKSGGSVFKGGISSPVSNLRSFWLVLSLLCIYFWEGVSLTLYSWLPWNFLCDSSWHGIQLKSSCLCPPLLELKTRTITGPCPFISSFFWDSICVAFAVLELTEIRLPLLPKCWD